MDIKEALTQPEWLIFLATTFIGAIGFLIKWYFFKEKEVPTTETQTNIDGLNIGGTQSTNSTYIGQYNEGLPPEQAGQILSAIITSNIPQWKEEALISFREESESIVKELIERINTSQLKIDIEEIKKPAAQYMLHETIKDASIRDGVDIDSLIKALEIRFSANQPALFTQTIDSCLRTINQLSKGQIEFLGLIHFIKHVSIGSVKSTTELNTHFYNVFNSLADGTTTSTAAAEYLASVGTLTINPVSDANIIISGLTRKYSFFSAEYTNNTDNYNSIREAVKWYTDKDIPLIHLTLTGKLIGCIALSKVYPNIDYKAWVN